MSMFRRVLTGLVPVTVVAGLLALASAAGAQALGDWSAFASCPVGDASVLASPAGAYTACADLDVGGRLTIGQTASLDPRISDQFGVLGATASSVSVVPASAAQSWSAPVLFSFYIQTAQLDGTCAGGPPE